VKPFPVSTNSLTKPPRKPALKILPWLLVLALPFGPMIGFGVPSADNLTAQLQKADRLDDTDHFLEALAMLKEAEKNDPDNVEILYRISRVESDLQEDLSDDGKKKDYALESVAYAKRAIEADADSSQAHLAAAIAYGIQTDFVDDKTKMEYSKLIKDEAEKAIELDPKNDYAYLVLARWNFEMTQLNPILRGIAELLYGRMPPASQEQALEEFQKAIALTPNRIIHHFYYGDALAKLGRKDQAKAEYQKVLRLTATSKEERGYQQQASSSLKTLGR
jgi:tetratricopeptide (TPR) repeat protein